MGNRRGARAVLAAAVVTLVVGGGAGPAATREGTNRGETLVGTDRADGVEDKGGNDTVRGPAGVDRYVFADGWGPDTLEEKPR